MRILAINPGSTSTKIAVFDDLNEVFTKTLRHSAEELSLFNKIIDQYEFRKKIILDALEDNKIPVTSLKAVVGRGGLLKPIPGGVYKVNNALINDLKMEFLGEHASNLGGILAQCLANEAGEKIDAFIVDPVVVDEMEDLARISGCPELPRVSIFHALNQKAVARRYGLVCLALETRREKARELISQNFDLTKHSLLIRQHTRYIKEKQTFIIDQENRHGKDHFCDT